MKLQRPLLCLIFLLVTLSFVALVIFLYNIPNDDSNGEISGYNTYNNSTMSVFFEYPAGWSIVENSESHQWGGAHIYKISQAETEQSILLRDIKWNSQDECSKSESNMIGSEEHLSPVSTVGGKRLFINYKDRYLYQQDGTTYTRNLSVFKSEPIDECNEILILTSHNEEGSEDEFLEILTHFLESLEFDQTSQVE